MNSDSELIWEVAVKFANEIINIKTHKNLSNLEENVFKGCWDNDDYHEIAEKLGYSIGHITAVGSKLWSKLSEALGEPVSKTTFRQPLRREWEKLCLHGNTLAAPLVKPQSLKSIENNFTFYIERPPIEERCYSEIFKSGCLLRIKAPWQTGKTELMSRIIDRAEQKGYRTAALNLRDATTEDFSNLDKFLQWFCNIIADRLELTASVEEQWHKSIGNSKIKCRSYFEKYVLPGDNPLVLALDDVDRIFPYREIASEFLGMLRTWHEDAKTRQLWQQLRQVVLHSEIYTEVDINQSPFNAGYEMALTDFNQEQVLDLSRKYRLDWELEKVTKLMAIVGGHPYLVGKAIEHIAQQDTTLEELLQTSHTAGGIYSRHLERHWRNLLSNPELAGAFQKIVLADSPVEFNSHLNQSMVVKLNDLGLVKLLNNCAIARYELYRQYFRDRFQDNL
jgi:AAA-like domain